MGRRGSSRRRFERDLERRSGEALDILEEAVAGDHPVRAVIAVLILDQLAERSIFRDVRVELVAAAELLRVPPAHIDPVRRRATLEALEWAAAEINRQRDLALES